MHPSAEVPCASNGARGASNIAPNSCRTLGLVFRALLACYYRCIATEWQQARIGRTRGNEEVEVEAFELAVDAQVRCIDAGSRRHQFAVLLSQLLPPCEASL